MVQEPITQPKKRRSLIPAVVVIVLVLVLAGAGGFAWYYFYGPCGVQTVKSALPDLKKIATRFDDANQLAGSTPRISLAGPISELQAIKRDVNDLEVPACMTKSKTLLARSMQTTIDGYIAFVGKESEQAVGVKFRDAKWQQALFADELKAVQECAPFCKKDNYDAAQ